MNDIEQGYFIDEQSGAVVRVRAATTLWLPPVYSSGPGHGRGADADEVDEGWGDDSASHADPTDDEHGDDGDAIDEDVNSSEADRDDPRRTAAQRASREVIPAPQFISILREIGPELPSHIPQTTYTETRKSGAGLVREEQERRLDRDEFDRLWPRTEGRRLNKERVSVVGSGADEYWVIDRFLDRPLVLAEIEFRSREAAEHIALPPWLVDSLVREVTGEPAFASSELACHDGVPG